MNPIKSLSASLFSTSTSNPKPRKRASRRSFLGTSLAVGGVVFVMVAIAQSALAQNLVRFSGGVGVIPTGSANTTVRGVAAAGQIWTIRDFAADVKQDGSIRLDGRGLLLASGNGVGSNANASVIATLFCANDGNVQHSSNLAGVPLEVNGDFRIDDMLSPVPPNPCTSPVLLIRSAGSGAWFAAGIPR
ncbi:MAG TPA: hypothetical protein VFH87_11485 [Candidatus Udaeobacter sp.]|jgi:hypothetical protein|nr:hypothetical protein [Candidatus Udaeobacter sp.]